MAMPFKKSAEPAVAKSARARTAEFEAERREITTRIVAMERRGVRAGSGVAVLLDVHAAAVALAAGENEPLPVIENEGAELQRLFDRRVVLDRALELLRSQEIVEEGERVRALMERERPEWMAALRKRALLAL